LLYVIILVTFLCICRPTGN